MDIMGRCVVGYLLDMGPRKEVMISHQCVSAGEGITTTWSIGTRDGRHCESKHISILISTLIYVDFV